MQPTQLSVGVANTETVSGYRIHYGTSSRNYNSVVDVGRPQATNGVIVSSVNGLLEGRRYYFSATAYTASDESDYSAEVAYTVPVAATTVPPTGSNTSTTTNGTTTPSDPVASINDPASGLGELVATSLASNIMYYTDRTYTLYDVPSEYIGMTLIKTPNDERSITMPTGYIKFQLLNNAMVYVAFDRRATSLPQWMSGFTYTGNNIYTSLASQDYLKIYSKAYLKNDYVDLGGNYAPGSSSETRSNYVVFYGQAGTAPGLSGGCTLVGNFQETTMQAGPYYTDRDYAITGGIPDWMTGRTLIRTSNDERLDKTASGYLTFTNPVDSWVYVLFDSRSASIPSWLNGWELRSDVRITTSLSSQDYLKAYRKRFATGQCVDLGGNYGPGSSTESRSNYVVVYGQ